jgi:hypothetical protein
MWMYLTSCIMRVVCVSSSCHLSEIILRSDAVLNKQNIRALKNEDKTSYSCAGAGEKNNACYIRWKRWG